MSPLIPAAGMAAAVLLLAGGAIADEQAGVPLAPGEAAGTWTLESQGRSICVLKLGAEKTKAGAYKVDAPASCGDALPSGLAGWWPDPGGMSLVDANGQSLISFGRWSNSLLVSHQTSSAT